ncbi:uncharacterized protein [Aquarana catesbeiana]|uniref:uncharacterized protein n=1 Tax=Aquarana catesbeiana TaxID=8400 RepID=UPI003CCA496F
MALAVSGGDNSTKGEDVNIWLLNYIKSHGGPYEIPQEYRQSWDLMKCFLSNNVFDKKTKEKKRKGIIIQGLLSCCTELIEEIKEKKQKILEQTQRYEEMEKGLNERISDLRLHAITTGEALIEKAKLCDDLSRVNEELSVKIQIVEKQLEECKHAANIAFDKLAEKSSYMHQNDTSKVKPDAKDYKPIYPWDELHAAPCIPAAPTTTTTVLNTDDSSEIKLITKQLKPQEMEAIIREIGQVPRYDVNRFMKWFCDLQRVRDTYNLNVEDLTRILQKSVGNGLWARILQNCGQRHKTKDVLKELLKALYGVTTNVCLSGKIRQMKDECPYELADRISIVMGYVMTGNPGFERGGLVHRAMLLEALDGDVREGILSVTPDPSDYSDILLRADNGWRRKCREDSLAVDAARTFRVEGQQNRDDSGPWRGRSYNTSGSYRRPEPRGKPSKQPWVPFSEIRSERDRLQEELYKIQEEMKKIKAGGVKVATVEKESAVSPSTSRC